MFIFSTSTRLFLFCGVYKYYKGAFYRSTSTIRSVSVVYDISIEGHYYVEEHHQEYILSGTYGYTIEEHFYRLRSTNRSIYGQWCMIFLLRSTHVEEHHQEYIWSVV